MIISKIGIVTIIFFMFTGLYLGLSGLCKMYVEEQIAKLDTQQDNLKKQLIKRTIDDLPAFENQYDYQYYITVRKYDDIFPLVVAMPSFLGLVLTAMCFGMIGSMVSIILRIVNDQYSKEDEVKYISEPVLGLFTGLCVLGISYVLPTILVSNSDTIRPITLMFFALFSGIYSKNFFEQIGTLFPQFLKSDTK